MNLCCKGRTLATLTRLPDGRTKYVITRKQLVIPGHAEGKEWAEQHGKKYIKVEIPFSYIVEDEEKNFPDYHGLIIKCRQCGSKEHLLTWAELKEAAGKVGRWDVGDLIKNKGKRNSASYLYRRCVLR